MSRAPRRQIDFTKVLIQVDSVDEFCQDDNNEIYEEGNPTSSIKKRPGVDNRGERDLGKKKDNIIIPVVKKIDDPLGALQSSDERLIKKRKQQTQYIRYTYCNPLPNPDVYEISTKDIEFLKDINDKISKSGKGAQPISNEVFEKIFEGWEHETAKEDPIALSRAITIAEPLVHASAKDSLPEIYDYWVKLRQKYKRPMIRKFLKVVNKDDNNPNAAFRTRENPKMKTRRAQKANDQEGLEKMKVLKKEMEMAQSLVGNVTYRELVKYEIFEINKLSNKKLILITS